MFKVKHTLTVDDCSSSPALTECYLRVTIVLGGRNFYSDVILIASSDYAAMQDRRSYIFYNRYEALRHLVKLKHNLILDYLKDTNQTFLMD